jgi:hypothetical protein
VPSLGANDARASLFLATLTCSSEAARERAAYLCCVGDAPNAKEITMNANARRIAATAAALAALAAAQAAGACEFTRTPWGVLATDCRLKDLYEGRYDLTIDRRPVDPWPLPNLVVTDVDGFVIDKGVDVSVELRNTGKRNAGPFDVTVVAGVTDPLNGGVGAVPPTPLGPVSVAGLASGASASKYAGRIFLPNRAQDWDVCAIATVDPPGAGAPAGRVWESNESDNGWPPPPSDGCCRVYGPKPDVNGPPACR